MEKYQKEISFISQTLQPDGNGGGNFVPELIKKTATFKELCRTDPEQKKLTWRIMGIFESANVEDKTSTAEENAKASAKISTDGLCDLADKYVKTMLITTEEFTEINKAEFLTDNGAMMQFGLWILNEKITPFFLELMRS